jgi:hypothetical protein
MKKPLLIILALFPIFLLINSCSKSSSSQPTPTKWSFSFDLNGQNHTASDISSNWSESCRYNNGRLVITWGSLTQPEVLNIKFPADTVGSYIVDNIHSYITYGIIAGNLSGGSRGGERIQITSVSNDNISGTFQGNLAGSTGGSHILTNGIFKAEK